MTTDRIDVDVQSGAVEQMLDGISTAARSPKPLLQSIGRSVTTRIRLGFKASKSPHGETWRPLKMRDGQPLRDTRRLQSSIGANVNGDGVDIGTNVLYARTHHFGAVIVPKAARWNERARKFLAFQVGGRTIFARSVTIPARPFMPVNASGQLDLPAAWQTGILSIIKRHVEGEKPKDGA